MAALIRPITLAAAAAWLTLTPPVAAPVDDVRPAAPPTLRASPAVERWRPYIAEAARRFGIPEAWIAAVMQAESAGQTHWNGRPITSHAGAMGLMQLMPGTWAAMRRRHGLGADPHDPRDNILAGAAYLRAMYDRFGYPGLFAAYNAGPGRYAEHLRTGRPLPAETRRYIAQLVGLSAGPSRAPPAAPAIVSGTRLFFPLGGAGNASGEGASAAPEALSDDAESDPLFARPRGSR